MAYSPKADDIDRALAAALPTVRRSLEAEMFRSNAIFERIVRRAEFVKTRAGFRITCEPPRAMSGGKSITVPIRFHGELSESMKSALESAAKPLPDLGPMFVPEPPRPLDTETR